MKAVAIPRFGGADVLETMDLPVPEPGPGEVAIDVAYAGANYAEILYRRGAVDVPLPFVPGIEVAGRVRALGEGVSGLEVGQPVAALTIVNSGGYAEVAVTDARLAVPAPEGVPLATAAALPSNSTPAILVWDRIARLRPDEVVLVHAAAGGVGSQLGQAARMLGAKRVVGTVGSPAKVEAANAFGYDEVLLRNEFAERADALTEGKGFDVIVDPVGGETRRASYEALAGGGRLIAMGNASNGDDVSFGANELWCAGKAVMGFNLAAFSATHPEVVHAALARAADALAAGEMRVDVNETLPLEEAEQAHRRIESGQTTGKIVLAVAP